MQKDDIVLSDLVSEKELDDLIDKEALDIVSETVGVSNSDQVKDFTSLFNQNILKKNMLRILKFNGLLDKLGDEALERLKSAEEIDDKDLIAYMKTIQTIIDSSSKVVYTLPENMPIQPVTTNTNITINTGEQSLSRESREKVLDIVSQIIKASSKNEGDK